VAPSNWFEGVGIVGAIRVHLDPSGNCTYNFSDPDPACFGTSRVELRKTERIASSVK